MSWHPHLWHPTTQVATSPEPLPVRAARGCELELADGRRLIDAISSWWVTLHGHAEPSIAAAIARQAQQLEPQQRFLAGRVALRAGHGAWGLRC